MKIVDMKKIVFLIGCLFFLFGCKLKRESPKIQSRDKPTVIVQKKAAKMIDLSKRNTMDTIEKEVSQKNKQNIEVKYKNNERILTFYDSGNRLIKRIDLRKNNPFWELEFKLLKQELYSKWFSLYDGSFNASLRNLFSEMKINPYVADSIFFQMYVGEILISNQTINNVAVAYPAEIMNKKGNNIGWIAKILVYNKEGNIIKSFDENKYGCLQVELSKGGKFLATRFGRGYLEDSVPTNVGYRFYDINSGKLLYQIENRFEDGLEWGEVYAIGKNKFKVKKEKYPEGSTYFIIDCLKNTIQQKTISFKDEEERGRISFFENHLTFRNTKDTLFYQNFDLESF